MKKPKSTLSRRRWFALGVFSTAGFWAAASGNRLGTRIWRELGRDPAHRLARPNHRPVPQTWDPNQITASWLGHSTVLLNFYGVTILTDPVLFPRVGANLGIGTVGPKRLIAPALSVEELPPVDLVLLSHAHMDHFDLPTLKCLPAGTQAITAPRTGDLFRKTRLKSPRELKWGEQAKLRTSAGPVTIEAFEVRHWGARWRHDTHRGYNGYVVAREGRRIIFGGDTALTNAFKALHSRGPYELAIMPIGAYQPWLCSHCTPEQAVRMANEAGAGFFLPVHHQTFPLGREERREPLRRLEAALEPERLAWREVGQTFRLGQAPSQRIVS